MEQFKKGSKYSRDQVYCIYYNEPKYPRNAGGIWTSGYWQIKERNE